MNIQIIKADLNSLEVIVELAKKTFIETYAKQNTNENMELYLKNAFNQGKMRDELMNPDSSFYLIESVKKIIGYLKVNVGSAQTESIAENTVEIERIYILQKYQGQGLGRTLIEKTIDLARFKGKTSIWLGVWKQNKNAIQFYEKLGFAVSGNHVFVFGTESQTDYIMKKQL